MRAAATLALLLMLLPGCVKPDEAEGTDPGVDGSCGSVDLAGLSLEDAEHSVIALETDEGCIVAEMYDDKAPKTVENFLQYVEDGFYDGTLFHRISKDFVIQGGGWSEDGTQKETRAPIVNEAKSSGLRNDAYTFSMARQNAPNTATSQFFINVVDNPGLDPGGFSADGYAVFAKVVAGKDVVDALHGVAVTTSDRHPYCISLEDRSGGSCPVDPVVLRSAHVLA